jgi:hypothetical protein
MTLPCGILNAICSNVGALLIRKMVPKLRMRSKHNEEHVTVILTTVLMYTNQALIPLIPFNRLGVEINVTPSTFSP